MPREQTPIRPIRVDYRCDECREGFYRPTGALLMTSPPKIPHECNVCHHKQTFTERYPTIRYSKEGEIIDLKNYQQDTL